MPEIVTGYDKLRDTLNPFFRRYSHNRMMAFCILLIVAVGIVGIFINNLSCKDISTVESHVETIVGSYFDQKVFIESSMTPSGIQLHKLKRDKGSRKVSICTLSVDSLNSDRTQKKVPESSGCGWPPNEFWTHPSQVDKWPRGFRWCEWEEADKTQWKAINTAIVDQYFMDQEASRISEIDSADRDADQSAAGCVADDKFYDTFKTSQQECPNPQAGCPPPCSVKQKRLGQNRNFKTMYDLAYMKTMYKYGNWLCFLSKPPYCFEKFSSYCAQPQTLDVLANLNSDAERIAAMDAHDGDIVLANGLGATCGRGPGFSAWSNYSRIPEPPESANYFFKYEHTYQVTIETLIPCSRSATAAIGAALGFATPIEIFATLVIAGILIFCGCSKPLSKTGKDASFMNLLRGAGIADIDANQKQVDELEKQLAEVKQELRQLQGHGPPAVASEPAAAAAQEPRSIFPHKNQVAPEAPKPEEIEDIVDDSLAKHHQGTFCTECGTPMAAGAIFCTECGHRA